MERLTKKHYAEKGYYMKCSETCEESGCDFCDSMADIVDRLGEYEDAEEQGRLMRLPCKAGDTFYYIAGTLRGNEYVASETVAAIEISDTESWIIDSCGGHHIEFWMTRAEAALKREQEQRKDGDRE